MVRGLFDVGSVRDPRHHTQCRAHHGADDADGEAVGPHHQSDVLVGGAEGAEHADGPHSPLGQDGEATHGDKPDEEHAEGSDEDHEDLWIESAVECVGRGEHLQPERGELGIGRIKQQRHLARGAKLSRQDQGELVEQVLRVLDDTDHMAGHPRVMPDTSHVEPEVRGHAGGNGHLAGRSREASADHAQHGLAVGAFGVLGPELVGGDRPGNRDGRASR